MAVTFSLLPVEIKEIIFGFLLRDYYVDDFKNNFYNSNYKSKVKRDYRNYICSQQNDRCSTVFDKHSKMLFQYGYGIQRIKTDMYDQILMCVCREWYNIVRYLRSKKNLPLKRYTWIGLTTTRKEMFEWAITQDISKTEKYRPIWGAISRYSVILGDMDTIDIISKNNYKYAFKPLLSSIMTGDLEFIKFIYNTSNCRKSNCRKSILKQVLKNNFEILRTAIIGGNIDIVKWVVNTFDPQFYNINTNHFLWAITYNHLNIVTLLYDKVDCFRQYLKYKYYYFKNVLRDFIINNRVDIMNWLCTIIHPKLSQYINDDDWHLCVKEDKLDILKIMISNSEYIPTKELLELTKTYNRPVIYQYIKEGDMW